MRRRTAPAGELWERRELALALLLALVAFVALVVCWWGASGERTFEDGKNWLIGAVVAAALLILAAVYLLLVGFRRLRDAKDDAVGRLLAAVPVVATEYLGAAPRMQATADRVAVSEVGVR